MGVDGDQHDFQPIFNIMFPKCFASGALPRTPLGGLQLPRPQLGNVGSHPCRGPHRIAGPRAPRPHDPPLRITALCIQGSQQSRQEISCNDQKEAYEELYTKLDTRKGVRIIYMFAKSRDRRSRDISTVAHINHLDRIVENQSDMEILLYTLQCRKPENATR